MNAAQPQNGSQPNASNQFPMWGKGGGYLSQLPYPLAGEGGIFTQGYQAMQNKWATHPILKALRQSAPGQMLGNRLGMNNNNQQPPAV